MIKKIKILQLKDVNFLIVPQPLEGELFSSWMVRTAYAHKTHPHTFENLYLDLPQRLFSKDIDVSINNETIQIVQNKCRDKVNIFSLTMQTYNTYLQERIVPNGFNKLITPLRYCPQCLKEDKVPYYRKNWKITFSTICMKHNCFLYGACPHCKSTLDISKMYNNKLPYTHCYKCGFKLEKSKKLSIHYTYRNHTRNTKEIFSILKHGYTKLNIIPIYSFYFFDTITQLSKVILTQKYFKIVEKHIPIQILKKWEKQTYNPTSPAYTQLPIKEQFILFGSILMLFDDYPHRIKSFILLNKLTYWKMLKDMRYVSFWFDNLINSITPKYVSTTQLITPEEIENAKLYLLSKKVSITKANLTRLLGCNFFSCYNKLTI